MLVNEGYSAGMIKASVDNMVLNKTKMITLMNKESQWEEALIGELKRKFKPLTQEEELCIKFTEEFYSKKFMNNGKENNKSKQKKK